MENIRIRNVEPEDLAAVEEIERAIFPGHSYPLFVFRQYYEITAGLFKVAETTDGKFVGFTIGHLDYQTKTGWIMALGVVKEFRKHGVGESLTRVVLQEMQKREARRIKLTVHPENLSAIGLYKRLGFLPVEEIADYFGDGEPRLIMEKSL
ncbi:MAG: GNAT family N-acetyltransferase [bacterium]|nr:GNAT family N-acetyltransferase [bacterium]